jgi:ABC-type long-subunit fatty acid transport system fused permease/ATPase subunit
MNLKNSIKLGFGATVGSMGASAIVGLIALVGILLAVMSKRKDGSKNKIMFGIGAALVVVAVLPSYMPIFGLSVMSESLSQ